jgi:saccharopine dehydrogenase (NAD+, L-lysine-forming)
MILRNLWKQPGVWNMEQHDPDPFMEELPQRGLPWEILDLPLPAKA